MYNNNKYVFFVLLKIEYVKNLKKRGHFFVIINVYFPHLQGPLSVTVVSCDSNEDNPHSNCSIRDSDHTSECVTNSNEPAETHERVKYCVIEDGKQENIEDEVVPLSTRTE